MLINSTSTFTSPTKFDLLTQHSEKNSLSYVAYYINYVFSNYIYYGLSQIIGSIIHDELKNLFFVIQFIKIKKNNKKHWKVTAVDFRLLILSNVCLISTD